MQIITVAKQPGQPKHIVATVLFQTQSFPCSNLHWLPSLLHITLNSKQHTHLYILLHCIPINDVHALYLPTYPVLPTYTIPGRSPSTKFQPLADIETLGHGLQDEMVTHCHTHVMLVETSWSGAYLTTLCTWANVHCPTWQRLRP